MSNKVNLKAYQDFVEAVTSNEANQLTSFIDRLDTLSETTDVNIPLFLNSAKRELGDIMWYWMNACRSLNLDPNDVIAENVHKLESRYPGGSFDVHYSENREEGDL